MRSFHAEARVFRDVGRPATARNEAGGEGGAPSLVRWVAMLDSNAAFCSLLALCAACAHGPSAAETLPKLQHALDEPVHSDSQNAENSILAEQVSKARHLEGLTRSEVAKQLGPGDPCSDHPLCAERGFTSDDRYFEIGRAGETYLRHRPALIVGFNRFGKVDRTFVLRVE